MNTYKVFFQIYGRKMVVTVYANSPEEAKEAVRQAIKFDRIEEPDISKMFEEIFK